MWKEELVSQFLEFNPGICLEGLRKAKKTLSASYGQKFEAGTSRMRSRTAKHSNYIQF